LIPIEKKRRPHRKTHGKITFQQLARMVGERWKTLPDAERKYYQDLANEDTKSRKAAMEQYYSKHNNNATTSMSAKSLTRSKDTDDDDDVVGGSKVVASVNEKLIKKKEIYTKGSKKLTADHKKQRNTPNSNTPFTAAVSAAITDIMV
jgi:HMG (high mobility group) box